AGSLSLRSVGLPALCRRIFSLDLFEFRGARSCDPCSGAHASPPAKRASGLASLRRLLSSRTLCNAAGTRLGSSAPLVHPLLPGPYQRGGALCRCAACPPPLQAPVSTLAIAGFCHRTSLEAPPRFLGNRSCASRNFHRRVGPALRS